MQVIIDLFVNHWMVWIIVMPILLPFIFAPVLPRNFKSKAVMELDCDVQKAYDAITTDPTKCCVGGSMTKALQVGEANKDGKPTEWKEDCGRGVVVTVKRDVGVKPKTVARMSQTMEFEMADMTGRWEYVIEPAEGSGRCRITLDGHTEIGKGKWNGPIYRMTIFLSGGGKKNMIEHLNLVADASGARRKWIA